MKRPQKTCRYTTLYRKYWIFQRKNGYINSADNIVLFSASINSGRNNVSESDKGIQEIISTLKDVAKDAGVKFEIIPSTEEDRQKALDQNLSMGRYAIYVKLWKKVSILTWKMPET